MQRTEAQLDYGRLAISLPGPRVMGDWRRSRVKPVATDGRVLTMNSFKLATVGAFEHE